MTQCRACYYSKEVTACPDCDYSCGEDPGHRCLRRWSRCVKRGLKKRVRLLNACAVNKNLMPHMYCMYSTYVHRYFLAGNEVQLNSSQSPYACTCVCGLAYISH